MNRKSIIISGMLLFCLCCCLPSDAQTRFYRYYSSPNGSYSFQQFGNNYSYPMPRSGQFYYRGSAQDMNRLMREFNQMFEGFFSNNQMPGMNNFGDNFSTTPNIPNIYGQNGNSANSFVPSVPEVSPAPSYSENPDIYY